jgi:hypothetical protein
MSGRLASVEEGASVVTEVPSGYVMVIASPTVSAVGLGTPTLRP